MPCRCYTSLPVQEIDGESHYDGEHNSSADVPTGTRTSYAQASLLTKRLANDARHESGAGYGHRRKVV